MSLIKQCKQCAIDGSERTALPLRRHADSQARRQARRRVALPPPSVTTKKFIVRDEDLKFYESVSPIFAGKKYLIPPPQLCTHHRERRRLAYRNERFLYRRKSSLSGQEMISFFHPEAPFTVYTKDEWWSDKWDALQYGRDFDFGRDFFEQFYELTLVVPRPPLVNNKSENSDYCNFADGNKNCYLITSADNNEDCYYGSLMAKNKNAVDCMWCMNSELLYQCVECHHCYNVRYSQHCDACSDSAFLLNCRSVRNSLLCVNLRNKEYHILNKPVQPEEYKKTMNEIAGSFAKYQEMLVRFNELKRQFPMRRANNFTSCENVIGDEIVNSKNIYLGFDAYDSRDCAYLSEGVVGSDCQDICYYDNVQFCYESNSLIGYGYRFTNFCKNSSDLFYCDNCHNCKNCFGCAGLRNKEYCIFNKQYTKEEYEQLAARIIEQMGGEAMRAHGASLPAGRHGAKPNEDLALPVRVQAELKNWGEFFPERYSIFPYNETVAQEYYPLQEAEARSLGLPWSTPRVSEHLPQKITLPDNISEVDDSVCNEILQCEKSGKNYRLIPQELEFYRTMKLPIPRKCPDVRHNERLELRNPRVLWPRTCQKCGAALQTSYSPGRPESIYCEKCYFEEVY